MCEEAARTVQEVHSTCGHEGVGDSPSRLSVP